MFLEHNAWKPKFNQRLALRDDSRTIHCDFLLSDRDFASYPFPLLSLNRQVFDNKCETSQETEKTITKNWKEKWQ